MLADDLVKAQVCERDGLLYAAGLREGYAYFEWSQDSGASQALFPVKTLGCVERIEGKFKRRRVKLPLVHRP